MTLAGRALALVSFFVCGAAFADVEEGWTALWSLHEAATAKGNHAVVADAADRMAVQADNPLAPAARALAAWHSMKAGRLDEARRRWEALAAAEATDPAGRAARVMAQRWLTRLDREDVRAALQAYYRRHIRYPDSLKTLAALREAPRWSPTDRWGQAWRYEAMALKRLGSPAQRYNLQSPVLGRDSDLAAALERQLEGPPLKPATVISAGAGGRSAVRFLAGAAEEPVVLAEGADYKGMTLAYLGRTRVLLSDGDRWWWLPLPGGGR